VGICGTDVAGYLGKMPFFTYPVIPGHELGVQVLAPANGEPSRFRAAAVLEAVAGGPTGAMP